MIEFITAGFHDLLNLIRGIEPAYVYLFLFTIAFAENIFPPLPGDTFTIIGGYLAAGGDLQVTPVFLCVTVGTVASAMVVYSLGRHGGRSYLLRKDLTIFSIRDLERVQAWFDRFGSGMLLASRFLVGVRVAVAFAAGLGRVRPARMAVLTAVSAMAFHGLLIILAYLMHANIDRLTHWFELYNKIILVIAGALAIIWFAIVIGRLRNEKRQA